jgi:hypothetical protein
MLTIFETHSGALNSQKRHFFEACTAARSRGCLCAVVSEAAATRDNCLKEKDEV